MAFLPDISRTEEESVSEVHENEHEIVGQGVGVDECRDVQHLNSWSSNDGELSFLDHEVILPIGLPSFLVPRCEL